MAISSEDLEREDEMVRMHRVLRGTTTRMGTGSSVFESTETAWKSGNIPNLSIVVWGQPVETVAHASKDGSSQKPSTKAYFKD